MIHGSAPTSSGWLPMWLPARLSRLMLPHRVRPDDSATYPLLDRRYGAGQGQRGGGDGHAGTARAGQGRGREGALVGTTVKEQGRGKAWCYRFEGGARPGVTDLRGGKAWRYRYEPRVRVEGQGSRDAGTGVEPGGWS